MSVCKSVSPFKMCWDARRNTKKEMETDGTRKLMESVAAVTKWVVVREIIVIKWNETRSRNHGTKRTQEEQ